MSFAFLSQARADPAAADDTQAGSAAAQAADAVVVTATRTEQDRLNVPASVDVIERETIRDAQLRVNASETLNHLAGVTALNRQNYAQDLQVSIRGFGARSTFGVRGLQLYVDGVPATLPDGQGQVSNFPLDAADHFEVLRGPFSALYGNSSGGVIALTTLLEPGPLSGEASVAAGSFATTREAASLHGGDASLLYSLDAQQFNTDGYRPHSGADRGILNLRAGLLQTPVGELRLSVNTLESANAQDPMGVTRTQLQNGVLTTPEAFTFNTRKSTRQGTFGANLRSDLGFATLETTAWTGYRGIWQYQAIPAAAQAPKTSSGGVIDLGRHFGGADSRMTFHNSIFTTTAGLNFQRLDEDRHGYNDYVGSPAQPTYGVKGQLRRAETNTVDTLDPYLQTEAELAQRWYAFAGVRSSHVRFDSSDHYIAPGNGNDSGSVSYSAINPTAGLTFRATPHVSYYMSYGRGFETPTLNELAYRSVLGTESGLNTSLQAARSNNYEIGAKTRFTPRLSGTLALYSIWTSNEIVVQASSGGRTVYTNAPKTRRDGIEAQVQADPTDHWRLAASAALIDARFQTAYCPASPCAPAQIVPSGAKLPSVPARSAWASAQYRSAWGNAALEVRAQSALYVNDMNSDYAGGAAVLNAVLEHTGTWGPLHPHFFARIDNLADHHYVGSVIVNDTNSRFFEPAPARSFLVGLDVPF